MEAKKPNNFITLKSFSNLWHKSDYLFLTEEEEQKKSGGVFSEWRAAVAGETVVERSESSIEVTGCCRSSETLEDRWRQGQQLPANVTTDD